jgi:hypothetical protein
MQMDYTGLTEPHFISSFIARLKDEIKNYLIPHCPKHFVKPIGKPRNMKKASW